MKKPASNQRCTLPVAGDAVAVTPLDQQKMLMNGKSYMRCKL